LLEDVLLERLRGASRLLVLGVGNELKGDDGGGVELARRLKEEGYLQRGVRIIEAGATPENFTAAIRKYHPSHVLIVDVAEMGLQPGSVRIVEKDDMAGLSFSTHVLPLSLLIDYLQNELDAKVVVLGIEPLRLEFGRGISDPVMKGIISLVGLLRKVLLRIGQE